MHSEPVTGDQWGGPLRRRASLSETFPDTWSIVTGMDGSLPGVIIVRINAPGGFSLTATIDHANITTKQQFDIAVIDAVNLLWGKYLHEKQLKEFCDEGVDRGVAQS